MSTKQKVLAVSNKTIQPPAENIAMRPFQDDDDFALIASLQRRCLQADRVFRLPSQGSIAHAFANLCGFIPGRDVVIAMQADKPVGYVRLHVHCDEEHRMLLHHRCFTLPRMRHAGLAEFLLSYAEGRLLARAINRNTLAGTFLTSEAYETEVEKWGLLERSGYRIETTYDDMVCNVGAVQAPIEAPDRWCVRPASSETIGAIVESARLHGIHTGSLENMSTLALNATQSQAGLVMTLHDEGVLMGYTLGRIDHHENRTLGRRRAYIEHVTLAPQRQGGEGDRFLMLSTLAQLKKVGLSEAVCRVDTDHPRCRRQWYADLGFKRIARYSSYLKRLN